MNKKYMAIIYVLMYAAALVGTAFLMEPGTSPLFLLKEKGLALLISLFPAGLGMALAIPIKCNSVIAIILIVSGYFVYLFHFFYAFSVEYSKWRYCRILLFLAVLLCLNVGGCAMAWHNLSGIH